MTIRKAKCVPSSHLASLWFEAIVNEFDILMPFTGDPQQDDQEFKIAQNVTARDTTSMMGLSPHEQISIAVQFLLLSDVVQAEQPTNLITPAAINEATEIQGTNSVT